MGFSWQAALAAVFVSGVVFLLISVTGIRKMIINAIPKQHKIGSWCGNGFFIAFVGLKNAGIIVANASTAVGLGSFQSPVVLLAVFGILVTIFLVIKKVPAAVFVGMIITAAVGIVAHEAFGVSVLDANGLELMPALPTSFISTNFEMSAMGSFMDGMGELFAVPGAAFVAIFSSCLLISLILPEPGCNRKSYRISK